MSFRISGRLGWTHPDMARFLASTGLDGLDAPTGLAPLALRDIKAGQAAGRFTVPDAEIALAAAVGGLLGLVGQLERHPEDIEQAVADQLVEAMLRMLGIPEAEAVRLAALPLPEIGGWQ